MLALLAVLLPKSLIEPGSSVAKHVLACPLQGILDFGV